MTAISPKAASSSFILARRSSSLASISSRVNTISVSVSNASSSWILATIALTLLRLKVDGPGSASNSDLISSSNSAISSSVKFSMNSVVYLCSFLLKRAISLRFFWINDSLASFASLSRALASTSAFSSFSSFFARRTSLSKALEAVMFDLILSSTQLKTRCES